MEKKLKYLFDYQKFSRNPRLDAMLADAEGRYTGELPDDAMEFVTAAGSGDMLMSDPSFILPIHPQEDDL